MVKTACNSWDDISPQFFTMPKFYTWIVCSHPICMCKDIDRVSYFEMKTLNVNSENASSVPNYHTSLITDSGLGVSVWLCLGLRIYAHRPPVLNCSRVFTAVFQSSAQSFDSVCETSVMVLFPLTHRNHRWRTGTERSRQQWPVTA